MTLQFKALLVVLGTVVLAVATHDLVIGVAPRQPSQHELGLAWLKTQYEVPDAAFEKIKALHEDYFQKCDAMCAQMLAAQRPDRHFPTRNVSPSQASTLRRRAETATLAQEKALCETCLNTMVDHLESVASLMPEGQGQRFLQDLLPELVNPRELQELRAQTRPVQ